MPDPLHDKEQRKRIQDKMWETIGYLEKEGISYKGIGALLLDVSIQAVQKGTPADVYRQLWWCEIMGRKWREEFEERFGGTYDLSELDKGNIVRLSPTAL